MEHVVNRLFKKKRLYYITCSKGLVEKKQLVTSNAFQGGQCVCFNSRRCYPVITAVYFSSADVGEASYSKYTC